MRIFILYVVFGFLFSCGPSEEKNEKDEKGEKHDSIPPAVKNSTQTTKQNLPKPPVKEMFTIFHAADDSESVYISGVGSNALKGFSLLPGECILLADYDFATLTVYVGTGASDIVNWEGAESVVEAIWVMLRRGFGYSHAVCGTYQEITCLPQNYLITNEGSWYNDNYVMKPQKSQYKDISKCVPIDDKVKY